MRVERAVQIVIKRYEKTKKLPGIIDPLGYALYKTWRDQNKDFNKKREQSEVATKCDTDK